ncbi:hypothetical protein FHU38_000440 [Saccharomonospora amisosensis]|uniref:DUF6779 domain-containing protein n=1 Tax=Saccharomonospora amisosensis TaxID=1128677 RepID=A0A7X5ULB3_9PSEU|nr:DUF6779 domain-containing protein [Saccharomonospora amisosensis]NIJ10096.1 hypothetical protein [Saccharomonospora amisosensis]
MSGVGEDSRGRASGRPLFAAGVLLAIAATVAMVFTEDLRWLRLGIIAALWAALIGGFVAARYRKQAATTEQAAAKAQEIYELELEREIAARREFELDVEAQTRERVEDETQEELQALRSEVTALRESLQALFGGEVLWERVALTAQSTRMRSLTEEPRVVTAGDSNGGRPAQITAGKKLAELAERPTELIAAVREFEAQSSQQAEHSAFDQSAFDQSAFDQSAFDHVEAEPEQQPEQPRTRFVPRPSRPAEQSRPSQRPVEPATRRVQPVDRGGLPGAREAAARARAEMSRPRQQPVNRPAARAERSRTESASAESRGVQGAATKAAHPPPTPPTRPAQHAPARSGPPADPARSAADKQEANPSSAARPQRPTKRQSPPEQPTEFTGGLDLDSAPTRTTRPPMEAERAARTTRREPAAEPQTRVTEPTPPQPNPTLPPEIREVRSRPGGRRRRAEPDDVEVPAVSGGRRYRSDDEPPPWEAFGETSGSRGGPEGRRAAGDTAGDYAAETDESSGSHAEGRSVSELLAAHGANVSRPRRRRRAD